MTREEYASNRRGTNPVLDSYDDTALAWGLTHRNAWKEVATRPFVAGTMVWTGFDYRGEPQPLSWPAAGSSFGCMDLCGFPKAAYYIHQAQWIQDRPVLHLIPHWNWAGSEGKPIKVMAFSNAGKVALILNGKPLEEKAVDKYQMVAFQVPYESGKLEAVATTDGKEVARFTVETTGEPAGLRLVPDRPSLAGDGCDAQPVTVEVVDAQGRVVPTANQSVKFELNGPGEIIGLNNGDPNCHEPEKGNQHSVFHGLAQVILQSGFASQGKLTLRAASEGLNAGEAVIGVAAAPSRPAVPIAGPRRASGN
jgi:beta-galactosidase